MKKSYFKFIFGNILKLKNIKVWKIIIKSIIIILLFKFFLKILKKFI